MIIEHKKNTAFELSFPMVDSATPANYKTGLSPVDTAYYKDGAGAWTGLAITDTAAEIGSTGVYEITLTVSEMNHDWVFIKFTSSGAADTLITFKMVTNNIDDVDAIVDAIKAKTDNLPAAPADDTSIDTQLATIAGYLDTEIAAIKAKTDNLPAAPADDTSIDTQLATIAGYLDTEVAAIKAVTDKVATALELDGEVYRYTANALEQAPGGAGDLLGGMVEGTVTVKQALSLFLAVLTGESSGGGTATITFRDVGDTKDRLVVTVDSNGNRTAVVTRDGT